MQIVRKINSVRLGGSVGRIKGNRDFRNRLSSEISALRPEIAIAPAEASFVVPPPPVTPKHSPPERPHFRPPPLLVNPNEAQRVALRTVRRLSPHFRPASRLFSELVPNQLVGPIIARAGAAHSRLPPIEAASSGIPHIPLLATLMARAWKSPMRRWRAGPNLEKLDRTRFHVYHDTRRQSRHRRRCRIATEPRI